MKQMMGVHVLLWIIFMFILSACDGLNINTLLKDIAKEEEKVDISLALSEVVMRGIDDESSIQISWKAPKKAEEVVIIAVPVSGDTPIEVVIPASEYKKNGQKYTLKGLQQKTQYEIKIKARTGKKESSEIKKSVAIFEDTTAPQDRLQSVRIVKVEKDIYLVWDKESIDKSNTDISILKVRVHTIVTKKVREVIVQDIAIGRESIGHIGLNIMNDVAYKVELVYMDMYQNAVSIVAVQHCIPSQLKEGIISIQTSKSELIGKVGKAIEVVTVHTIPKQATGVFRVSSLLPAGLKLNSATGEITGVPTEVVSYTTYTITYSGNGDYGGTAKTTVTVHIEQGTSISQYRPKTKEELRNIIEAEIQKQGNKADLNIIDTSLITDMSSLLKDMVLFQGDISGWNTSNVTDMSRMFYGVKAFNGDISKWDTSSVTDMSYMFYGFSGEYFVYHPTQSSYKTNVFQRDISQWDTSNVITMESMFELAPFVIVDVSGWDTSNVVTMSKMFSGANSFNGDISVWNTGRVTTMHKMFYRAFNFNSDISQWDTSNVTDMSYMFGSARYFNQDISDWDTSNVIDMSYMFSSDYRTYIYHEDLPKFNRDISDWDTSNVKNMNRMFYRARRFNQDISNWNTSNVIDMSYMFAYAQVFNQGISGWDTSNVIDMGGMFAHTKDFNQNISAWDVSKVTNTKGMFHTAVSFNQDISNWNTSNVEDMNIMFFKATMFNQDISSWNTSSVTDMGYMFAYATMFNQDISDWNTRNVRNMEGLFFYASSFNGNVADWNVGNVENMVYMFSNATVFNQDISRWNTENVVNMSYMFDNAKVFYQDISGWDVRKVTNWKDMFKGTSMNVSIFKKQSIGNSASLTN